MAGSHAIEERTGEEGGGLWCGRVEPTIPCKEYFMDRGLLGRQLTFDLKHISH